MNALEVIPSGYDTNRTAWYGVNNIQRVLGVLGDIKSNTKEEYKPRPIYKHFDDQRYTI